MHKYAIVMRRNTMWYHVGVLDLVKLRNNKELAVLNLVNSSK